MSMHSIIAGRRMLGALVLLLGMLCPALAGATQYLTSIADLPLAPGLVEDVGAGVSFDKPEGRIVEAVARGVLAADAVAAFYRATLPGLGWQPLAGAAARWGRGSEILSVDIVDGGTPLTVRFSLAPK